MVWVVNVPVAYPSCVEIKPVVFVGDKASCAVFLVKDVPSIFVFLVFEEFYCDSSLVVVGVISSYQFVPAVFVFKFVKGD